LSFTGLSFILRRMSGPGPQETGRTGQTEPTGQTEESGRTTRAGESRAAGQTRRLLRPLVARNTEEPHRASTPLELLFDLCFVVAVSQAARELNASLALNHIGTGIVGYLAVFFAIWWAWVNFTWFASAYDNDDLVYRLLTFVQIVGVLILAAGVPSAFVHGDFAVMTIGYVVMRIALVAQWLRAARGEPSGRSAARRYAVAITLVQVGWVVRLFLPQPAGEVMFCVLALAEMLVPAWAERGGRGTSWHPQHISERYGLFTLIVLGECVEAATVAMQSATRSGLSAPQVGVAAGGLLLIFELWWWYFEHPSEEGLRESRNLAFLWGYAHYAVFGSVAALGAGLEVAVESTRRGSGVSPTTAGVTIAVSVAVYLVVTGAVQVRLNPTGVLKTRFIIPFAALILVVGWNARALSIGIALPVLGVIVFGLVLLDRLAPALHRAVDDPSTPSLA
jgi:low temperature requirement protein LtrA